MNYLQILLGQLLGQGNLSQDQLGLFLSQLNRLQQGNNQQQAQSAPAMMRQAPQATRVMSPKINNQAKRNVTPQPTASPTMSALSGMRGRITNPTIFGG